MAKENPGLGCLPFKLTKAEIAELQAAIDVVENLCAKYVIPGMCVVQYKNTSRTFGTISFSNQVSSKADMSVDSLVKLEKIFCDHNTDDSDVINIWNNATDLLEKYESRD